METEELDNSMDDMHDLGSSEYQEQLEEKYQQARNWLQLRQWDVTPDAKNDFSDINRDMVNSNLDEVEIAYIKTSEKLVGYIDYLMNKGMNLDSLKKVVNKYFKDVEDIRVL